MSTYVTVGQRPAPRQARKFSMPETEARSECSCLAAQLLARVLREEPKLLPEWCAAADAAGCRAPDEQIPAILDAIAQNHIGLDPELALRLVGSRGAWLAQLNDRWQVAKSAEDAEANWRHGTPPQRFQALRTMRQRNPDTARNWIDESWSSEAPDERMKIVALLQDGLSSADEEFLETVLDDKRKTVRDAAAELLARLPQAQYCRRMTERSVAWLVLGQRGVLRRKSTFAISVPDDLDASMIRDGLQVRAARGGLGAKAQILAQALAATPLPTWDGDPETLIASAGKSDWRDALLWGWGQASARQANTEWCVALSREMNTIIATERKDSSTAFVWEPCLEEMAKVLPALHLEPLALNGLTKRSNRNAIRILKLCQHSWSEDFSRKVLHWLRAELTARDAVYNLELRNLARTFLPFHMSPSLAEEAAANWPRESEAWTKGLEETIGALLNVLRLRQAYLRELRK